VPGRLLVDNLNLDVAAGETLAVLGPNGVGKSLTLHTLAGLAPAPPGTVLFGGRALADWPRAELARHIALLPQYVEDVFPATVMDTVMIGRHPHIPRFHWESASDRRIAADALAAVDLAALAHRDIATLSGGERRRLAIAQVLTQAPGIYLLDEPTNHLDPQHQLDALGLFSRRAAAGAAVVTSLHDVNLAARFADRCLLLYGDGRWEIGRTAEVLTARRLSELYATSMESVAWRDSQLFVAAGPESGAARDPAAGSGHVAGQHG